MLAYIFKFFYIYFCSLIISFKLMHFTISEKKHKILLLIFSLTLSLLTFYLKQQYLHNTYIISLLIQWCYLGLITSQPHNSFIVNIIGFALSYIIYALSGIVCLIFLIPFYHINFMYFTDIFSFLSGITSLFLTSRLFKIKRFKKGMNFLISTSFLNLATLLSLLLILFLTYIQNNNLSFRMKEITPYIFISAFAFLIHWWQAQITKSYKHSLMIREIDSLRVEVEEKDAAIALLKAQNEELGRLIHHDNKRIPAMENAVCAFLISEPEDMEILRARGEMLCLEIESLSRNRNNTLKEIYSQRTKQHHTGLPALDTLLNYMDKRANAEGTAFSVNNSLELSLYVPKQITLEDLNHLLFDLLENALIATNGMTAPSVQLQFYVSEKRFVIEVADNGIPFQMESLLHFGRSRLTTHAQTGGSGIGLMDIWKIKEKYGATLHIEEYKTPAPFTKKISLVFNHKNHYSIRTYRSDEIRQCSSRSDLSIYDYEN